MSVHRMAARRLTEHETSDLVRSVAAHVSQVCMPVRILLFGSAVRGAMTDQSDVDLILLFADETTREIGRQSFFSRPYGKVGVDALFFTESEYAHRAALGGVCFVAAREGRDLSLAARCT
jgi:predicted nucleotidyltransferase